jgi:hypothetical protein
MTCEYGTIEILNRLIKNMNNSEVYYGTRI